jgi:hypothetical protein
MSERRDGEELDDPLDDDEDDEELDEDEEVEYLVEVSLESSCCFTSVPKSVQLSHTSNSAPSTLMVLGDPVSSPHISH